METSKNIQFDFRSIYLNEKDKVNVIQKALTEDGTLIKERYEAFFMGLKQFETYSPWMYVFAIKENNEIFIRYVSPSEICEINYRITQPTINMLNE